MNWSASQSRRLQSASRVCCWLGVAAVYVKRQCGHGGRDLGGGGGVGVTVGAAVGGAETGSEAGLVGGPEGAVHAKVAQGGAVCFGGLGRG